MKKNFPMFIFFLAMMSLSLYGQDKEQNSDSPRRFALSWSISYAGHPEAFSRTSTLGLGFTIFHNDRIDIRNQMEFCNGVMVRENFDTSHFKKVFADKISIGKFTRNNLFRPYGFVEGRIGTSGEELYNFGDNPMVYNAGLGTGLDIYATESLSYFMEVAFLGNFYEGEFLPQQRFELGVMYHF